MDILKKFLESPYFVDFVNFQNKVWFNKLPHAVSVN